MSSSHFCSEVRERVAAFSAGTKQCSGQVALMPGQQAPESIFSPLPWLLNSLIPSPWYRGFKVAFAKIGRKIYLSRAINAPISLSVFILIDIFGYKGLTDEGY